MKTNNKEWHFPDTIDFETAPRLAGRMEELSIQDKILFDLSRTTAVHSSFIGLLIHLKNSLECRGGILMLKTSPDIDRILEMLNLDDFFSKSTH